MTGFTDILKVKKALRRIDVTGKEIIGEGYSALVYRIDKETIAKVFKYYTSADEIERELNLAKQAFILGIPTAISYDVVKVDDKYGVLFEMLNSVTLKDLFNQYPEKFDELIDKYVASKSPLDKAGAYGVQDNDKYPIIKKVIGSVDNVIGFPLKEIIDAIKEIKK